MNYKMMGRFHALILAMEALFMLPALIISLLMICFNLFGNGLRDAFNPALRGVEA